MQVHVMVNGATLCALLNLGLTHNFIDTDAAARVGDTHSARTGLCVAVANGDYISRSGCYLKLHLTIGGEPFNIDLHSTALGTYDMVLGV
jgi:hypothetical protein